MEKYGRVRFLYVNYILESIIIKFTFIVEPSLFFI